MVFAIHVSKKIEKRFPDDEWEVMDFDEIRSALEEDASPKSDATSFYARKHRKTAAPGLPPPRPNPKRLPP